MFEVREKETPEFIARCAMYARAERHAEEQALAIFIARNPKTGAEGVAAYLLRRLVLNG